MSQTDNRMQSIITEEAPIPTNEKERSITTVCPTSLTNSSSDEKNVTNVFTFEDTGIENQPVVTRRELWTYYLFYNGNNGVVPYIFTPTLLQLLASSAGYDPEHGPDSSCNAENSSGNCVVPWGRDTKSVASVMLLASGISFAVLTMIFTTVCSVADYGNLGRKMILIFSCIFFASQFAWMSLTVTSRWPIAMALYIIGFICYGSLSTLYAATYPRLARNTNRSKILCQQYESGQITKEEYTIKESLEMNRISNISIMNSCIGVIIVMCLCISLLLTLKNNPLVNNYTIVLTNGYFLITGIWWFIFQQPRPGPPLPKGENYCTIGWKQLWIALKECRQLPNTFIYLVTTFFLADGINTAYTLVSILQNKKFSYSFLQNSYFGLIQTIAGLISLLGMWYTQKYRKTSTKKMFVASSVISFLIPLWGMVGIWTNTIGFHKIWEFWTYNALFGLFQIPYFAFAQTMMAELTPSGFENLFFGLYGMTTRVSAMIGPYIVQAIVDRTGNSWMGFTFLFAVCMAASILLWFGVDMQKGKRDALAWEKRNRSSMRAH